MATIRAYTTIEQSRKLAEILPLESADNVIVTFGCREGTKTVVMPKKTLDIIKTPFTDIRETTMCWSLAALLDVFEDKGFFYKLYFDGVSNVLKVINIDNPNIHEMNYNDYAIDVCYEMILKLHKQKLL